MSSGIYKIINKVNSKLYVGSTKDFEQRKKRHFYDLNRNKHHSAKLQRAYNKYGEDSFEFQTIEECEFDALTDREQYWMDTYNSYGDGGYNCSIMAHRAMNSYGNMVSEKTMQKNGHYLESFLVLLNLYFLELFHLSFGLKQLYLTTFLIPL